MSYVRLHSRAFLYERHNSCEKSRIKLIKKVIDTAPVMNIVHILNNIQYFDPAGG